MRRIELVGFLVGTLALLACPSAPGNRSPDGGGGGGTIEPPPPPPSATLSVADPSGSPGPFAIAGLDRLLIDVDCAHLAPGPHAIRVAVMSPSGSLYAQLPATLQVDDSRQGRASSTLEVRGTTIESYGRTGTWQLVAFVDGVQLAAASVELTN